MRSIEGLYNLIKSRQDVAAEKSYTKYLFEQGSDKICKKIGEEAAELIIATKNKDKEEITNEACDLIFHVLVNLVNEGISLQAIDEELTNRANVTSNLKDKNTKGSI